MFTKCPHCRTVMTVALAQLRVARGRVRCGHCVKSFHALDYLLQEVDENDPKLVEIREETKRRYKAEIEPLVGDLKKVSFKYLPADPALEVCKQARNMQTDLIILGCHQLPEKMCMGRIDYVGMTILEKAPCPVMLVPLCE